MGIGIAFQMAVATSAMLAVAFAPPARGRMMLAPLDGRPVSDAMVIRARAKPLAPGPLPGSRIVEGERSLLAGLLISDGILILAAPAPACVSTVTRENDS